MYRKTENTPVAEVIPHLTPERQLLLKAAGILRQHGHCKYEMGPRGGPRCAMGALYDANRDDIIGHMNSFHAASLLVNRLGLRRDEWAPRAVAAWNDAPERTAEEVIAAMEGAAYS